MKRGAIVITQEMLKQLMKDKIPDDFLISGVEFESRQNTIRIDGYSNKFHETAENCLHLVESGVDFDEVFHENNLIKLDKNLELVTTYVASTREFTITITYHPSTQMLPEITLLKARYTLLNPRIGRDYPPQGGSGVTNL